MPIRGNFWTRGVNGGLRLIRNSRVAHYGITFTHDALPTQCPTLRIMDSLT